LDVNSIDSKAPAWSEVSERASALPLADTQARTAALPMAAARLWFVDALRCIAALQMLQGHTIAALLEPSARSGALYEVWTWARGLTSVTFLFAAGLSFHLASERSNGRARRVRRAFGLIALGYLLHLPISALWAGSSLQLAAAERAFACVDVLHCIGMSLLGLEALAWLSPLARSRGTLAAAIGIGLLTFAAASGAASPAADSLPAWLGAYFGSQTGSLFPLVPYAAHVCVGAAAGAIVSGAGERIPARLLALAAALLLASVLFQHLGAAALAVDHLQRLAAVVALSAALALACRQLDGLPAWVRATASSTLFLYVFHVLLVYGDRLGLRALIGPRLAPSEAVLAALSVVVVSLAALLTYRRWLRPSLAGGFGKRYEARGHRRKNCS
jgi:uncharacterized membrane protein